MDIIHRLNPFHRPPSSLRSSQTPTPTLTHNSNARPSSSLESGSNHLSIDSTLPPHTYSPYAGGDEHHRYSTCPVPPTSPIRGHHRTPSILRTLAHHPSLSALKSKSKKKRKAKGEAVPPLPSPGATEHGMYLEGNEMGIGGGGGKLRKGSLKLSKSLPRDLRLKDGYQDEMPPPVPARPLLPTSSHNHLTYPRSASRGTPPTNKQISSIRRKPAPSPSPSSLREDGAIPYAYDQSVDYDHFPTPESMRLKMKFEIDIPTRSSSYEQSPSASHDRPGLGLGSPTRRRYMSFDERLSPPRSKIRPLSSPADSPPRFRPPKTNQTTQAIPTSQSHLYAQSLYADSPTFFSTDFGAPPVQSLDWPEEAVDDGLDLFIANDTLPPGTPGGRKEDLQRGVLTDGVKHEQDAVRFFSRDTYPPPSPSPETTPSKQTPTKSTLKFSPSKSPRHRRAESSPACSPLRRPASHKSDFSKAAKRSSSPFEVKLSANATKRMSLDAFGTSMLTISNNDQEPMEEVLEVDREEHEGVSQEDHDDFTRDTEGSETEHLQLEDNGLEGYEAHELSKITESPFSEDHSTCMETLYLEQTPVNRPTISDTRTRFYTPLSPTLNALGLPVFNDVSPSPMLRRKYMSAPPLSTTTSLLEAHADHSKALKDQLKAGELMMDVLKSEIDEMKALVRNQEKQEENQELEIQARINEIEDLKVRCEAKDIALNQLRQAMKENEEFFENLQEAQHFLAERCAKLEEDNLKLTMMKNEADVSIRKWGEANEGMKMDLGKMKNTNSLLNNDKKELESVVFELRRELKWAENEITAKEKLIQDKEDADLELKQQFEATKEELETARAGLKEKDLANQTLESQRLLNISDEAASALKEELRLAQQEVMEKEEMIGNLHQDLEGSKQDVQDERAVARELEMNIHEQEFTISSLREQLNSAQQSSESINLFLLEKDSKLDSLTSDLLDSQAETRTLKAQAVDKDATIASLKEKVDLTRYEKNERRFQAEVEINQLHKQLEELSRSSAEREWAGKQGTEMIAKLMEEKRVWEEERDELIEMINQNALNEESASNLRDQISNHQNQLSSLKHHMEILQHELEDSKSAVQHKSTLIHAQEAELSALRLTVNQFEESSSMSKEAFDKQMKDSERVENRFRERIEELEIQLQSRENALKESIIRNESSKQSSTDVNSRLMAYLNEIDQLKLKESKFNIELEEMRKHSLDDTLRISSLEKDVENLKEDKELLNIALESKTLELTLLHRNTNSSSVSHKRIVPSTPSSTSTLRASHGYTPSSSTLSTSRSSRNSFSSISSMSKSTSKIPNTPTPSTGIDNTPLPRRLTTSTSATTNSRLRRDTISSGSERKPLGGSTAHNKLSTTQDTKPEVKALSASGTAGGGTKTIQRRTSLPVLVRRPSTAMKVQDGRRESLSRVDEV